jgi:hypothetical protein
MEKDYALRGIWSDALHAMYKVNSYSWETASYGPRKWHLDIQNRYLLHPLIGRILFNDFVRPHNWQQLLLEWPHVSDDDEMMIAYTRDEKAGLDFIYNGSRRQTKTSIGKYLSRHWPHVPDHVRRDWAGRMSASKYEIWETMEGIISGVELGPQSCMKSSYGSIPFKSHNREALVEYRAGTLPHSSVPWSRHPYIVYAPRYGWRMAVRIDAGKPDIVMGRCLINVTDNSYVRSYKRGESDTDYSHTDEKLEAWLEGEGYSHSSGWGGHKLDRCEHPSGDGLMLPYLDGREQRAEVVHDSLCIAPHGQLDGSNTNGLGGVEHESIGTCDRCNSEVYEDDDERLWVGADEDVLVCGCCADRYTNVLGRCESSRTGRRSYFVRDMNVVHVDGIDYDEDNLPHYIRTLHDDTLCHENFCVYLEEEGAHYLTDDTDIVAVDDDWYLKDSDTVTYCADGEYRLRDECWQDAESDKWYSNDVDAVEIEDKKYHPNTVKQWLTDAGQTTLNLE